MEGRGGLQSGKPGWALFVPTAISTCGFIDRVVLNVLVQPIKAEFALSDTQIGLLAGFAFALPNVALGLWLARIAERRRRHAPHPRGAGAAALRPHMRTGRPLRTAPPRKSDDGQTRSGSPWRRASTSSRIPVGESASNGARPSPLDRPTAKLAWVRPSLPSGRR